MHVKNSLLLRSAGFIAGAGLALCGAGSFAAEKYTDAFPKFESYIKLSGRAPDVTGNEAAYQTRSRQPSNGGGGIEELYFSKDIAKDVTLQVDGRALAGVEDYLLHINIAKEGLGSVDAGYKSFRTFYDGIGGFFPINKGWYPLADEDLHTDRGRFWVEAKLALKEDQPVFTVRYTNETRDGTKDSTIWADSNLTGLPTIPANNALRKILPAYRALDERHEVLEGSVRHTLGKTTVNLRVLGDWVNNNDYLFYTKFSSYNGVVDPAGAERSFYQRDGLSTKSSAAFATTETVLTDRVSLNAGLSYQHLTSDISGERPNAIGVLPTFDFKDLAGGSEVTVYTANAALIMQPVKDWRVSVALRGEDSYSKSAGTFNRVTGTVAAPVTTAFKTFERIKEKILTPDVSFRYTGISKLVIYGTASDRINRGDERRIDQYSTPLPTNAQYWPMDVNQDLAHYTFGANWNASSVFTFRGEVFHKDHENKFLGNQAKIGESYVIGYQFTGLKLTAIVKPIPQLSFTTRYQPQKGKMQVTTEATPTFDSMDAESHLISETIDWNPTKSFYAQANLNIAYNTISTAYPSSANPNQRNSDNNYQSGSVLVGWVLNKSTDANLQYTYLKADNFMPSLAALTQPYGASFKESTFTLGLKRKLTDKCIGEAKVGYFDAQNDTTGGRTNFRGPVAYLSLTYAL